MRFDFGFSETAWLLRTQRCSDAAERIHPASLSFSSCLIVDFVLDTGHEPRSHRRPAEPSRAERPLPSAVLQKMRRGGRKSGFGTLARASLRTLS